MKKTILSASDATATAQFLSEYLDDYGDAWGEDGLQNILARVAEALSRADQIAIVPDDIKGNEEEERLAQWRAE